MIINQSDIYVEKLSSNSQVKLNGIILVFSLRFPLKEGSVFHEILNWLWFRCWQLTFRSLVLKQVLVNRNS